jgi:hypothetical protein
MTDINYPALLNNKCINICHINDNEKNIIYNCEKDITENLLSKKNTDGYDIIYEVAEPYIDVYEFQIENYIDSGNQIYSFNFNEIKLAEKNKCENIKVKNPVTQKDESSSLSSCDYITSNSGGAVVFDLSYKEFYKNYTIWGSKSYGYSDYIEKNKTELQNKFIEKLDKAKQIHTKYCDKYKLGKVIPQHEDALIYHIKATDNQKIVMFGDFHGSFHTFIRHIERLKIMGILDNNLRINDNYMIIFLGDILDRGQYSFEILNIILDLIIKNNTEDKLKIIYNRGNHEEESTYEHYGFTKELLGKKIFDNDIKQKLVNLYNYLPSAIILQYKNYRYWLSHGCIPIVDTIVNNTNYKDTIEQIKKINNNEILHIDNKYLHEDIKNLPFQIRWNDICIDSSCDNNTYLLNPGRALVLGGKFILEKIAEYNLDFIIRGHQDSIANSFLLSNNNPFILGKKESRINFTPEYIYYNNMERKIETTKKINLAKYYNGSIVSLKANFKNIIFIDDSGSLNPINNNYINTDSKNKIYPVLTISTNTGEGRELTKDSFIILNLPHQKYEFKDKNGVLLKVGDILKPNNNNIKFKVYDTKSNKIKEITYQNKLDEIKPEKGFDLLLNKFNYKTKKIEVLLDINSGSKSRYISEVDSKDIEKI